MLGKLKKRKRLRTHGYLSRSETPGGRNVLKRRRQKGRWKLTPSYAKRLQTTKGSKKFHIVPANKK